MDGRAETAMEGWKGVRDGLTIFAGKCEVTITTTIPSTSPSTSTSTGRRRRRRRRRPSEGIRDADGSWIHNCKKGMKRLPRLVWRLVSE